jgi:hypothetical protein
MEVNRAIIEKKLDGICSYAICNEQRKMEYTREDPPSILTCVL